MAETAARPDTGCFLCDEEGAVTVDWVVITAAIMLLSIPVLGAIRPAVTTGMENIGAKVVDSTD